MGFEQIINYLRSDIRSIEGLTLLEVDCMNSTLDYPLIPYRIEFKASLICELKDGRLCCSYDTDAIVWNMEHTMTSVSYEAHNESNAIEISMKGH